MGMRVLQTSAEEVQDAISAMYAIMQQHGGYIAQEGGSEGRQAIAAAAEAMLLVLQVLLAVEQFYRTIVACFM
jgi:hypothetical protein